MESNRERLTALALALAPELRERPLYILTAADLGIQPTAQGCGGIVGLATDLACRDAIGSAWHGRGWCIVLASDQDAEGTLLHELAHVLDGTMPWRELDVVPVETVASVILGDLHQDFVAFNRPVDAAWHGMEFHRALIHLRQRALALGVCVGWHELGATSRCPLNLLAAALSAELEQGRCRSFMQIMARPMPRRFRKLWNRRHIAAERNETMTLSALVQCLRGRRQAAVKSYSDAVERIAEDGKITVEVLERLLASAGKTPEDFQKDVERLRRRRQAAQTIRDAGDCPDRRRAASQKLAAAQEILDRAQAAFDDVAADVESEMAMVRAKEQSAREAANYLRDSAAPELAERDHDAVRAASAATREVSAASFEVSRLTQALRAAEQQLADVAAGRVEMVGGSRYIGPEISESACQERVEQLRVALEAAEDRLQAARKYLEQSSRQSAHTSEALLVP